MPAPTVTPVGRKAIIGTRWSASGVWGTEQALSGGNAWLGNCSLPNYKPAQHFIKASSSPHKQGEVLLDINGGGGAGNLKGDLHYDGDCMRSLFVMLGADTKTGPTDTSAYTHTAVWTDTTTCIGTVGWFQNETNAEFQLARSAMMDKWSLDLKSNAPAKLDCKLIVDRTLSNLAGTAPTTVAADFATIDAAVTDQFRNRPVLMWHAETVSSRNSGFVRIKALTGSEGNCSSTDDIAVSGIKVTLDRKLKAADTQYRTASQPVEDEQPDIHVELELPTAAGPIDVNSSIYNLLTEMATQPGASPKEYKLDLYFEDVRLAGAASAKYSLRLLFPRGAVKVDNVQHSGMGRYTTKLMFTAMKATSASNGSDWSGVTQPVKAIAVNQNSAAYI